MMSSSEETILSAITLYSELELDAIIDGLSAQVCVSQEILYQN